MSTWNDVLLSSSLTDKHRDIIHSIKKKDNFFRRVGKVSSEAAILSDTLDGWV